MKVLEFFSGIGGWRCALDKHLNIVESVSESKSELQSQSACDHARANRFVIAESFDINTVANQVYQHNFNAQPNPKCINSLTRKALDKHAAGMWCMSPPCQPYTRNNTSAKRDTNDQRSNAFLHLVQLLKEVHSRPQYILLENVVGFETSECCAKFLQTLSELNYSYLEFILSPTQFGTPNSRPRYYLVATQTQTQTEIQVTRPQREGDKEEQRAQCMSPLWQRLARGADPEHQKEERQQQVGLGEEGVSDRESEGDKVLRRRGSILLHLPSGDAGWSSSVSLKGEDSVSNFHEMPPRVLADFLDPPSLDDTALLIPRSILEKPSSWCFDIVTPLDTHSACFTKAYTRYARGTGSVLSTAAWGPEQRHIAAGGEEVVPAKRSRVESDEVPGASWRRKCEGCDKEAPAAGNESDGTGAKNDEELLNILGKRDGDEGSKGESPQQAQKKFLSEHQISTLRLRYFSPRELLRLFGFPPPTAFCFPEHISSRKAYELIGNSLNVDVAAQLIRFLTENTQIFPVAS